MKIRVDLHKKEIRALMFCISIRDESKATLKMKKKLKKVDLDKLHIKMSNILYENTFPENIVP